VFLVQAWQPPWLEKMFTANARFGIAYGSLPTQEQVESRSDGLTEVLQIACHARAPHADARAC